MTGLSPVAVTDNCAHALECFPHRHVHMRLQGVSREVKDRDFCFVVPFCDLDGELASAPLSPRVPRANVAVCASKLQFRVHELGVGGLSQFHHCCWWLDAKTDSHSYHLVRSHEMSRVLEPSTPVAVFAEQWGEVGHVQADSPFVVKVFHDQHAC